jgi:peptidyl-dipeptidase A
MIVCARTTIDDFYVIVHEMGHIHYYKAYQNQPVIVKVRSQQKKTEKTNLFISLHFLKEGSNSALQESIGDAMYLAFMTPQHLHRLELINDRELFTGGEKRENNMNGLDLELLLRMGLAKIPQIPFEYIMV